MSRTITRVELYNQVWSTPVAQLSRILGYSDVGIAKMCRKHEIPRPPRGYWAKKQAGQSPRQVPLPDPSNNCVIELRDPDMNHFSQTPAEAAAVDRPPIKVAETLRGCHNLVSQANEQLQGAETDQHGILITPQNPVLAIHVSKKSLRRALLLMDAILKAAEASHYEINRGPALKMRGVIVQFSLSEALETKEEQPADHDLEGSYSFGYNRFNRKRVPSGRLEFNIPDAKYYWMQGCRSVWRDGKKRLEDCLNRFMLGLETTAARLKTHQEEQQRKEEERRAEELRRQEQARQLAEKRARFEAERGRVEALRKQAKDWKEAENLRAFIETARQQCQERGPNEPDSEFAKWLEWALQQADRLDPFRPSPPSILDEKFEEVKNEPSPRRYR